MTGYEEVSEDAIRALRTRLTATTRRPWRAWLALAVFVGLALFSVSSCGAQMVATVRDTIDSVEPSVSYKYLNGVEGTTLCYHGKSLSFLNLTAGMSREEEEDVRAHEAAHRAQHIRAGGCEKFAKIYNTPKGMLEAEAEAFHAGACVAIAGGMDAADMETMYVRRIYSVYLGGGTPIYEVLEAYRRYPCEATP
jgi:hypothetical protein